MSVLQNVALSIHPYRLLEVHLDNIEARRLPNQEGAAVAAPLAIGVANTEPDGQKIEMRLSVSVGVPESDMLLFFIRLDIIGTVEGPAEAPREHLKVFVQRQAIALLWPYAREAVQSISSRLGVQTVTLPTAQVIPFLPPHPTTAQPQPADPDSSAREESTPPNAEGESGRVPE